MIGTIKQRVAAGALTLSILGVGAIVSHEGMRKVAYVDPVGVVTVCAGHTRTARLGQRLTDAQCGELLRSDVSHAEDAVRRLVKAPLTQAQFDALTSFVFNVGEGSFANSTLLRKLNANDCWGAGAEFSRWDLAGGKKLPGLTKRRASERKYFEAGCFRGKYSVRAPKHEVNRYAALAGTWAQARRPEPLSLAILARKAEQRAIPRGTA